MPKVDLFTNINILGLILDVNSRGMKKWNVSKIEKIVVSVAIFVDFDSGCVLVLVLLLWIVMLLLLLLLLLLLMLLLLWCLIVRFDSTYSCHGTLIAQNRTARSIAQSNLVRANNCSRAPCLRVQIITHIHVRISN